MPFNFNSIPSTISSQLNSAITNLSVPNVPIVPSGVPPSGVPSGVPPEVPPSGVPSVVPPLGRPSGVPSGVPPSGRPSGVPSGVPPSGRPSGVPSGVPPLGRPSGVPSGVPPSGRPSGVPPSGSQTQLPNVDTVEQIVNDIQNLQKIEQDLVNTLDANPILTPEQQQQLINKINSISNMRINLYETLSEISGLYEHALSNSKGTLSQQTRIIDTVEKQLNDSKKKLHYLESEKNNKIRLIEINDYYGQKYSEHSSLMKYIILMLIPIIIITFLFNKGFLPKIIYLILLVIIGVIGSVFIVYRLLSIWNRDNMNYQAYLWSFNVKNAPSAVNTNDNDPWSANLSIGTCIGDKCCSNGMTFDNTSDKCIAPCSSNPKTGTSVKEKFMNNIFTKKSSCYKKPDVTLNNIIRPSNY